MSKEINSLSFYERRRVEMLNAIGMEKTRHEREAKRLDDEYRATLASIGALLANVDLEKVALAKTVIKVSGLYERAGDDRAWAVEEAVRRIADGGEKLRHKYVGTKSYAQWYGQSVEHSYGMGPSHGSVIFDIGLTRTVRDRPECQALLTPEEADAAIYYLRCLKQIQQAEQDAKVPA